MEVLEAAIITIFVMAACIVIWLAVSQTFTHITSAGSEATLLSCIEHAVSEPGIYTARIACSETIRVEDSRLYVGDRVYTYRNVAFSGSVPPGCHMVQCASYRVCTWDRCIMYVFLICTG